MYRREIYEMLPFIGVESVKTIDMLLNHLTSDMDAALPDHISNKSKEQQSLQIVRALAQDLYSHGVSNRTLAESCSVKSSNFRSWRTCSIESPCIGKAFCNVLIPVLIELRRKFAWEESKDANSEEARAAIRSLHGNA
jgi:hypothetical protein